MATFKIHLDDENSTSQLLQGKPKTLGHRAVLGVISGNSEISRDLANLKPRDDPKWNVACQIQQKENVTDSEESPSTSSLYIDDIKTKLARSEALKYKHNEVESQDTAESLEAIEEIRKKLEKNNVKFDSKAKSESVNTKESSDRDDDKENQSADLIKFDDVHLKHHELHRPDPESVLSVRLESYFACAIYKDDIFNYLKILEKQFMPKPLYMKRQPDITYSMRTILVDWLVEVGEEYKLQNETLFMSVAFIDRFLSSMAVVRAKLQLLGTTAMFIASKFEEIYPPEINDFIYITDDTYSKKQVLRMEQLILKSLSFNLSGPTSYTFIMHICASIRLPDEVKHLAVYLCELTLLEGDPYLEFSPSVIACSALALANYILGYVEYWPLKMTKATGYNIKQLSEVMKHLNTTHLKSFTIPQTAIREKYKKIKNHCVSTVPAKQFHIRD